MANDPRYAGAPPVANDDDADDMNYPTTPGTADGHADCVPSDDGIWPGQDSDDSE